jgi:hypothetical protein
LEATCRATQTSTADATTSASNSMQNGVHLRIVAVVKQVDDAQGKCFGVGRVNQNERCWTVIA